MTKNYEDETYCADCDEFYGDLDPVCPECGGNLVCPAELAEMRYEQHVDRLIDQAMDDRMED